MATNPLATNPVGVTYISQPLEMILIDKVASEIRERNWVQTDLKPAILQLSYEYSGLFAQLLAHKLSYNGEPMPIEPINIPYKSEFKVTLRPEQLDPYGQFIVLDSGCLSGGNFTRVQGQLLDYGYSPKDLIFTCLACSSKATFKPNVCPLVFDGENTMVHFWWECKSDKFS